MDLVAYSLPVMQSTDIITARPHPLARAFWGRYFEWSVRRAFHTVYVSGAAHLEPWRTRSISEPLIIAATHASWWDAALAIVLSERWTGIESYGIMEHKQLVRYQFFRGIGMMSVVRENPRSALRTIQHAADTLQGTSRVLWMFPQGTLIHQDQRPIVCEPGVGILAAKLPAVWIVPVAMRYELLREQRPYSWIDVGTPYRVEGGSPREVTSAVQEQMTLRANAVKEAAMAEQDEGFEALVRGRMSMEKRFDHLRRKR